ncbi:glycosyltransferase 87 family protein [Plantactinospora sp. WMMB782]|uniref:glycosyltransferase 87 family protein n=1 Tax=Plantactinospora sp. WMMB782 TaxID=3404121 RepID=UPI003B95039E
MSGTDERDDSAATRATAGRRYWRRADRAAGGLAADLVLYLLSTGFAALTAATSTLLPHRAWGSVAAFGYLAASILVLGQLLVRRSRPGSWLAGTAARGGLTVLTWVATALLPLVWQAVERVGGRLDRAQEEVVVVENSGARLVEHGTPYLTRDAIAALPGGEQLLGYTPYQPGMALFGLPRALAGTAWWTDARIWFAVATAVALGLAVLLLRRPAVPAPAPRDAGPAPARGNNERDSDHNNDHDSTSGSDRRAVSALRDAALVRAVQLATVLPVCALTLATGGDDLPVLALCLLALGYAARDRFVGAGLAVGLAAALKLFAWPVGLVLLVHAAVRGRRPGLRLAVGALGLPVVALVPAQLVDSAALVENVLRFPLGHGLVNSPAASPFPGYLIAQSLPAGRVVAAGLLVATGLLIAVLLLRRPPRTAASAALFCGYGLLAAILLMPSTRFGYLLYPVAFLAWVPALRLAATPEPEHTAATSGDADPASATTRETPARSS